MPTALTRGEYKTPGGKLVGVSLERDADGRVLTCHIDGDFFVDGGDDADARRLLDTLERSLASGVCAATVMRGYTGTRVVGVDAQAFDIAFARAMRRDETLYLPPDSKLQSHGSMAAQLPGSSPRSYSRSADEKRPVSAQMARTRWAALRPRVLHDQPRTPADQMRVDEQWARRLAAGQDTALLRIWEWGAPAVIIGRFQSLHDEVDLDEANRAGITVVRRCTGGGAMFVEPGNTITYSLYAPLSFVDGVDIAQSYRLCDQWLIDALGALGMDVHFSGLNDIASPQGKIGGAAQRRFPAVAGGPGAVLHHVTLAYDIDAEKMGRVLTVSHEKMSDKAVRSAVKRVDPLRSQTGMSRETLIRHLIASATSGGYNGSEST